MPKTPEKQAKDLGSPSTLAMPSLCRMDRQPTDPYSVVFDDHDRPSFQVRGNINQRGQNDTNLISRGVGLPPQQNDAWHRITASSQ